MARFLVGIDLGTTNTALAAIDADRVARGQSPGRRDLQTFAVPQLVGPGTVGERPLLPSFLYLPGPHDLPPGSAALPWDPAAKDIVGEFARAHGGRVPGRLVSSAKSWLCHPGVDRAAALLPWGAPPDVPRLSPLEASARYLRHLARAWDHARPDAPLGKQPVVLTVPASFDDVARNLTLEAARQAGLELVTLLEEPQAAFYGWLATHPPAEAQRLKPGMRCLVVDVGGGTSDFSLIRCVEDAGEIGFERQAVGEHLLLGGDNMDLALAKAAEAKMPQAGRLDAAQFGQLVQGSRAAKEALLGPNPPAGVSVTVAGRGRSVVGGTLHATLTGEDVRRALLDGFFPAVAYDADARQPGPARGGLHEMGLPYVADAAVTRHLAAFLRRHLDGEGGPDAILFNGGVFQPASLRDRLVEVMRPWYPAGWEPLVLTSPSLDLGVAWGAAYAGWLRHTGGRRIGGGLARSYYVGIEVSGEERGVREEGVGAGAPSEARSSLTPHSSSLTPVLCVVPRSLQEGEEVVIKQPELELALGEPVLFPLFTSTARGDDKAGDLLTLGPGKLRPLPPLFTVLKGGKRSAGAARRVPVWLAAKCTEVGTLELACVAADGTNRWRLEFAVRDAGFDHDGDGDAPAGIVETWPEALALDAGKLVRGAYPEAGEPEPSPKELTRALETALESRREDWPTGLCRRMWDFLLEVAEERRRSPAHLARWYNLAGFCLRPGFGDPLDRHRIDQLWKLLNAPPRKGPALAAAGTGVVTRPGAGGGGGPAVTEGGGDFWVMWRRVAGGLPTPLQQALFDKLRPVLLPGKGKGAARPGANELAEMWRAAAGLERLDPRVKEQLGDVLVRLLKRPPVPNFVLWSLTRLGARSLLYGPLNAVAHPDAAARWAEDVLAFEPATDGDRRDRLFALSQLARRTGQRALDVGDDLADRVAAALKRDAAPAEWVRAVEEVSAPEAADRNRMFGEALPVGLRLR